MERNGKQLPCDIVVGGQWGDEGKAKIIDYLSGNYDVIVRYQGGANAGHTVKTGGKSYVFHLVPSGILYPHTTCVLGNGVVIDPSELLKEIKALEDSGIEVRSRLKISSLAHVVMPYHQAQDKAREEMSSRKIGTTARGIGPAYSDKIGRVGIRFCDLQKPEKLKERITAAVSEKQALFTHYYKSQFDFNIDKLTEDVLALFSQLAPCVDQTPYYLNEELAAGKRILFEGAQGAGLDIDFGSYPFVTSSSPASGGAATGSGVGIMNFSRVIGVFKAYITRVGAGALPTSLEGAAMEELRKTGGEYGATTGRPRECGWFDGVQARYSRMINSLTDVALTKLDILDNYSSIFYCTHYEINGKRTSRFPELVTDFDAAKPVYKKFKGWKCSTAGITEYSKLPDAAKEYIDFLQSDVACPVTLLSTGPNRGETINRFK